MKKIVLYTLVSFALMGCGGGGSGASGESNDPATGGSGTPSQNTSQVFDAPVIDTVLKQAYLDAINNARAIQQDCGVKGIKGAVSALEWSDELYAAAYEHSDDLAESDTFAHDGSGTSSDWTAQVKELGRGSTFVERIKNNGYTNYKTIGENIVAGTNRDTAQIAIDAWLDSDGHCANLMNTDYTEIGMGHVEKAGTDYIHYWTQNFGAR